MSKSIGQLSASVTTGSQKAGRTLPNGIGAGHGKTGSYEISTGPLMELPAWTQNLPDHVQHLLQSPTSTDDLADQAEWVAGSIRTLLFHYYIPEKDADVADMAIVDWIEILEPFSQECILQARKQWIRTKTRRPSPKELHDICVHIIAKAR